MFATVFALAIYSIALIWIGATYRRSTPEEYLIAGRRVGFIRMVASTFTLIGGGEFVTLTALSYDFGYWSLLFFGGVFIGFLVLAWLVPRAREYAKQENMLGLPDFFHLHLGRAGSVTATLLATISLLALLLIQLVVGGLMLATTSGFPVTVCVIGMSVVLVLYVYFGGLQGVLATDLIQGAIMFVVIAILATVYTTLAPEGGTVLAGQHVPLPLSESIPLILLGACAVIGGADVWVRVIAAKDNKTASSGLRTSGVAFFMFGFFIVFLAHKIQLVYPDADPNEAFFTMLGGQLPAWLTGLTTLLLFSALLSTADTEIHVLSVMLHKGFSRSENGAELSHSVTRWYVIIVTAIACILALSFQQLVGIYFFLLYFMMILGPVSVACLLRRGGGLLGVVGMWGGVAVLIYLLFTGGMIGYWQLLIVIPPCLAFFGPSRKSKRA